MSSWRRLVAIVAFAASFSLCCCSSAAALELETVGTFQRPIFVTSDPGNPDRLLVVERAGTVVEVGTDGTKLLADLTSLVSCCEGERGLLSIVPAPDFGSTGRFYADYAGTSAAGGQEGDIHLDSFRPDPQGGGGLLRESILSIEHSLHDNHHGGQLQFGPDGDLYVSVGDGGGPGDPLESGQNTDTLLGKVLRIEPHPGQGPPYTIPSGNPFVGKAGRDEIWAYGLRNPWRFSFDRASGDMVIGDVGQDGHEEVDYAPSPAPGVVSGAGANYGWNCREGLFAYPDAPSGCEPAGAFVDPVFDYPHEDPGGGAAHGCAIVGGYVVRDPSLGDLYGRYVYSDYCTGEIRSLALPGTDGEPVGDDRSEGLSVDFPTSLGEDSCGRLYIASNDGRVYRLIGVQPSPSCSRPLAVAQGPAEKSVRARLLLHAKSERARLKLVARVSPCAGYEGARVQLNRGGKRLAIKRLDRNCIARFFAHIDVASTFRALLRGASPVRSRRLAVGSPRSGRRP
ncbi:MAG: PQQ-dependent sugar dehydrogenase [Solirubrobacterales bacterium]